MPSPSPGMDPYLELPVFWPEFHNRLIVAIADALIPSLLPHYYIGVETRTLSVSTEVRQRYLEVRETGTDAVITVIEVLSPVSKRNGEGRVTYEAKRQRISDGASHFVEIDLLRADAPMAMQGVVMESDYRILVSCSERRPRAELYGFMVDDVIPSFPLPLRLVSELVMVNLQAIVQGVYERGGYVVRIDYAANDLL